MNEINESVVNGGERMIDLGIRRSAKGIILSVKAHPIFEEFFAAQQGESVEVAEFSRHWHSLSAKPLKVWHIVQDPGTVRGTSATYQINRPGSGIVIQDQNFGKVINLSFLRLVGISEGDGISFEIRGAFTLNYIRQLASELSGAVKQLYIDFLKPVDVMITVSTQENR